MFFVYVKGKSNPCNNLNINLQLVEKQWDKGQFIEVLHN